MSIGNTLAQARREAGLSIPQVSQRTRIRETIITAIEQDDFAPCGGEFYARGHIRAIARVVGVDSIPLIDEFDTGDPGGYFTGSDPSAESPPTAQPPGENGSVSLWPADGDGGSGAMGSPGTNDRFSTHYPSSVHEHFSTPHLHEPFSTPQPFGTREYLRAERPVAAEHPRGAEDADTEVKAPGDAASNATAGYDPAGYGTAGYGTATYDTPLGDTDPGDTDPGDTDPGDTDPGDTDPGSTIRDDTASYRTEKSYGPASYGTGSYGAASYGTGSYGAASYGSESYGTESYGPASYGTPSYGAPSYGTPSYGAARDGTVANGTAATPAAAGAGFPGDEHATRARRRLNWSAMLAVALLAVIGYGTYLLISGTHAPKETPAAANHRAAGHAAPSAARSASSPSPSPTPSAPSAPQPLSPASISAFGPDGAGQGDNPQLAQFALDGNAGNSWHSDWYTTPEFGNLQPGTGLLLDMGKTVTIQTAQVALGDVTGADIQLRVGNVPTLAGLPTAAQAAGAGGTVSLRPTAPAQGRYVLVWFTKLPQDPAGTFQASVSNITVQGHT